MDDVVDAQHPGLWVHRGAAPPMREFHRHDDLEVNVVVTGRLRYLFGGRAVTVPQGSTALFWAATPHRLIDEDTPVEDTPLGDAVGEADSDICWLHVPLATALLWPLPESFGRHVLTQGVVVVPTAALGDHVVDTFTTWSRDLSARRDVVPPSVLLEAQALTLRVLAAHPGDRDDSPRPAAGDLRPVALMARYAAENFREEVGAADVARAAHLTPNYATTLFRRTLGVTLGEQLTQHRVAEAQRLLLTTSLTTAAVAHAAGFGSQSSLYAHFTRVCGCSPAVYRRALRTPG